MKYTVSDSYYSYKPKPWKEIPDLFSKEEKENFIKKYWYKNLYVWDADNCNNLYVYFAFSDESYYRLDYSWWINYAPEWEIYNEYYITKVDKEEAMKHCCSNRDWLKL